MASAGVLASTSLKSKPRTKNIHSFLLQFGTNNEVVNPWHRQSIRRLPINSFFSSHCPTVTHNISYQLFLSVTQSHCQTQYILSTVPIRHTVPLSHTIYPIKSFYPSHSLTVTHNIFYQQFLSVTQSHCHKQYIISTVPIRHTVPLLHTIYPINSSYPSHSPKIGRASCRERVFQPV
jgi:hypothetical protein